MAGIYLHVPFCASKCTYCDFASYPREIGKVELYFACMYKEMRARAKQYAGRTIDTVYFGGGTPSFVDEKYIVGAMRLIREVFTLSEDAEITVEINPGTLTEAKLAAYKGVGINRFSVGLQSADDAMLCRLNRIHNLKDFSKAAELLQGENFSVDVLLGLYDHTQAQLDETLDVCIGCGASHVSAYALKAEEGTPLFGDYLNGDLPSDDEVAELYEHTVKRLKKAGFDRYEVSNFARDGKRSRHNENYWRRGEYIGVGVAASGHVDGRRYTNTSVIDEYIKCIMSGSYAEIFSEDVTAEDAEFEYIMLALRTADGFSKKEYKQLFGKDFDTEFADALKRQGAYLDLIGDRVKIKDEYLYVQNSIIIDFLNKT